MVFLELDSNFYPLDEKQKEATKTCPKCHKGELKTRAELRFVHLFHFPIFPIHTYKQTYCGRCYKVLERNPLKEKVIPILHLASKFIGLFAILLFLLNWWSYSQEQKLKELSYLEDPLNHDVWLINEAKQLNEVDQEDRFRVFQVVNSDSEHVNLKVSQVVYLSVNSTKKAIRLDNLMIRGYFSKETVALAKSELVKLKQSGVIHSVHRPQNLSLFGGVVMMPSLPKPIVPTHKPNPLNQDAIALYQDREFEAAAELFEQAAKQGSAWAQYNLANMYLEGEGVDRNVDIARQYLEQAAAQNHRRAQIALAELE